MGSGAQMTTAERQVTLRNDGHGLLRIYSLSLVDVSDSMSIGSPLPKSMVEVHTWER